MIDLLVPTRARPDRLRKMIASAMDTAMFPEGIVVCARIDHDDYDTIEAQSQLMAEFDSLEFIEGERAPFGVMWNEAFEATQNPIVMMCGDDTVFVSPEWDAQLVSFFDKRDPYWLAYGPDGIQNRNLATHPITTRKAAVDRGYYTWPDFTMGYVDTWLFDIYQRAGRTAYLPEVAIRHEHFTVAPEVFDETYEYERAKRHLESTKIWNATVRQRIDAAHAMTRRIRGRDV